MTKAPGHGHCGPAPPQRSPAQPAEPPLTHVLQTMGALLAPVSLSHPRQVSQHILSPLPSECQPPPHPPIATTLLLASASPSAGQSGPLNCFYSSLPVLCPLYNGFKTRSFAVTCIPPFIQRVCGSTYRVPGTVLRGKTVVIRIS